MKWYLQKRNGSACRASRVYLFMNNVKKLNMYHMISERTAATLSKPTACGLFETCTDLRASVLTLAVVASMVAGCRWWEKSSVMKARLHTENTMTTTLKLRSASQCLHHSCKPNHQPYISCNVTHNHIAAEVTSSDRTKCIFINQQLNDVLE